VLADIGGYTRYLAGVELEHSHDILADLLGVVANELISVGPLAKLEGDAVFVCDSGGSTDRHTLLAGIDATYAAFANRRRTIELRTTCECDACARIPQLDLKVIAHHGSFIEHIVAGSAEIVGSDVILAHRLLKNTVADRTGVKAFALITDACARTLGIDGPGFGLIRHIELYDDVGEVGGWVSDIGARWRDAAARTVARVGAEEADFNVQHTYRAPTSAIWDAVTAPDKILRWKVGATAVHSSDPGGVRDVGSRTHCVHGPQAFDQEILDWRPFSYFTYREIGPYGPFTWTIELVGDAELTTVNVLVKLLGGHRQRALMRLGRRRFVRLIEQGLANLEAVVNSDRGEAASMQP
jgi:uncharacterized protein YndB with AHSA1/START domain